MRKTILLLVLGLCYNYVFSQNYRLVLPKDSYVFADSVITFKWSAVDSATTYDIQLASDSDFLFQLTGQNNIASTTWQITLPFGATYYWRIKANTPGALWSYSRKFSVFKPSQLTGLIVWFDAARNVTTTGGLVSQWADLSASNLVATPPGNPNRPTLIANVTQINNKPVVSFSGSTSTPTYLTFSPINVTDYTAVIFRNYYSLPQPPTYMQYVVGGPACGLCAEANYYGNSKYGSYAKVGSADKLFVANSQSGVTGYGVYTTQRDHVFRNGIEPILSYADPIPPLTFSALGTRPDFLTLAYKGEIGEILLYDNSLSSSNRLLAEGYLRYKFSKHVDLGSDTIINKFCVNVPLTATSGFTSYLWSTGATTSSISVTNFGKYWVRATDNLGYVSSDTINVRPQIPFNQLPSAMFLCAGDSIVWNTGYPATGFQFTWSTGATTPSIVIKTPGTYSVSIKDAFNCTFNSASVHVTVDQFPNYTLGPDTSFCSGNRLNFMYPDSLTSIVWSTGDTVTEPVITSPGNYSVTAINANGCVAKDTIHVAISGYAPTVDFSNPILCATDSLLFTNLSTPPSGNIIVWQTWNFGNNDTTNEVNPTHVFTTNGSVTVSLTAVTDSGCINGITKTLAVYLKPNANFQSKISCALAQTQFTDFSTTAPPATVVLWKWHFTDTDSSILENPVYSFSTPAKYEVDLKVTNSDGCVGYFSDSVEVFSPFSANFDFQDVCVGDSTSFTDITQSLSIVSWFWNTGDNFFSTRKNFKHKYATPGNYVVSLKVQNAIGCIDSINKLVTIYQNPTAEFNDLATCEDQYYSPLDNSIVHEPINYWRWNIGGAVYNTPSPQHFFADTGTYAGVLFVTSQNGCKDSVSHLIQVKPTPSAQFVFAPAYGDAPLNVTFTNQSANADIYNWNFGDGFTDTEKNTAHIFTANGTFQIELVATSSFGCADSVTKTITVIPTELDISVDEVYTNPAPQSDGTVLISVGAVVSNIGTRIINNIRLYATTGSGGVISEDWTGTLQSGQVLNYSFNSKFVVATEKANSYVCVEAKSVNNNETETRIDNNRECASLTGTLQVIGPSPNPAREIAYLGLILPKAGNVVVDVINQLGQPVIEQQNLDLPAGRTDYSVPVKLLRAGEYFIRVKHNDDKLLKKLVVH